MKQSNYYNSKQAVKQIEGIKTVKDLDAFIAENEDRVTVLKARDKRASELEGGVTASVIKPVAKAPVKAPAQTDKKKRVKFVSNGSNPRLGKKGNVTNPSEYNAQLFANNGWGKIDG